MIASCILIIYGETITLIDSGVAGARVRIFETIRSSGRSPSEIALIILTHSHPDHIGSANAIQQKTGCSIAAHPAERAWIEDVDLQNRERPVPGFATLVGGSVNIDHELKEGILSSLMRPVKKRCRFLPHPVIRRVQFRSSSTMKEHFFLGMRSQSAGDMPVYDDALFSVRSVKKLKTIRGIRVLLSSWDEPRKDGYAYRQMDLALNYLQHIHEVVLDSAGEGNPDPMELTIKSAAALGLPKTAVNPLLARTFAANLRCGIGRTCSKDF